MVTPEEVNNTVRGAIKRSGLETQAPSFCDEEREDDEWPEFLESMCSIGHEGDEKVTKILERNRRTGRKRGMMDGRTVTNRLLNDPPFMRWKRKRSTELP